MENASKALIIAGAILLSIAIIGIGMYVFNMASGTINQANMSGQEIDAYNSEFSKYEGTQNGSTVKAMLDTIRSHNLTNSDDTSKQIVVNGQTTGEAPNERATGIATDCQAIGDDEVVGTASGTINSIKSHVKSGSRYVVSFGYSTTGIIKRIHITVPTT